MCACYREYEMPLEEKLNLILDGKTEEEVFTPEQVDALNKLRFQIDVLESEER